MLALPLIPMKPVIVYISYSDGVPKHESMPVVHTEAAVPLNAIQGAA